MTEKELKLFAAQIRLETLEIFGHRGFGHVGGALSIVDVLAVLYGKIMNIRPDDPNWKDRDMLVMSKGHAGPALYATLALKGYFPKSILETLNRPGTTLPSHCDRKLTPGVDMTTGSLGQGVSCALGLALAHKMDGRKNRVFLITGDGELNEGQCWEAASFAPHHNLNNLIWIVDCNGKQLDGRTNDVLNLRDLKKKFASFGWYTQNIDGGDIGEISDALQKAIKKTKQPSCIIANTIKGAGIPDIEEIELNHHIVFEGELYDRSVKHALRMLQSLQQQ